MDEARDLPSTVLESTTFALSRASRIARGRLTDRLAVYGVRLWHVAVLAALEDFGPAAQHELGTRLRIDPSDLVNVMDHLERSGRVQRRRDPADRRRYMISLADEGRAALAAVRREVTATEDEVFGVLDPAERDTLREYLHRVLAHLDRQDGR